MTRVSPRPDLSAASDHQLVALAREGREEAFTELVRRYRRPVLELIYRMVRRHEPAEDLTQETFFKAVEALDRHPPERNFPAWIRSIAHNAVTDYVRIKRLDTVPLDDSPVVTPPSGKIKVTAVQVADQSGSPSHSGALEPALGPAIEQAIGKLKGPYRKVVMLRLVEKRSYEKIAEILHVPVATVASYLHRARHQLKQMLGPLRSSSPPGSPSTLPLR